MWVPISILLQRRENRTIHPGSISSNVKQNKIRLKYYKNKPPRKKNIPEIMKLEVSFAAHNENYEVLGAIFLHQKLKFKKVTKRRIRQTRNEQKLYHMASNQSFIGTELDVLKAAAAHYDVKFELYYGYEKLMSNFENNDPTAYVLYLVTDSPDRLLNLHLCTDFEDVVYIPQNIRSRGLIKRLDVWLGLEKGSIEPNPAELPASDAESIVNQFDEIEEKYKVSSTIFDMLSYVYRVFHTV